MRGDFIVTGTKKPVHFKNYAPILAKALADADKKAIEATAKAEAMEPVKDLRSYRQIYDEKLKISHEELASNPLIIAEAERWAKMRNSQPRKVKFDQAKHNVAQLKKVHKSWESTDCKLVSFGLVGNRPVLFCTGTSAKAAVKHLKSFKGIDLAALIPLFESDAGIVGSNVSKPGKSSTSAIDKRREELRKRLNFKYREAFPLSDGIDWNNFDPDHVLGWPSTINISRCFCWTIKEMDTIESANIMFCDGSKDPL